ncbi:hypothetical protein E2542_SST21624 [Spatholobus suberectus]|nr:hypothetical protein E2542_SST21624 [Spatholobus suberectus]
MPLSSSSSSSSPSLEMQKLWSSVAAQSLPKRSMGRPYSLQKRTTIVRQMTELYYKIKTASVVKYLAFFMSAKEGMAELVKLPTIQFSMVDSEGPKLEASSWLLVAERIKHVELRAAHTLELHRHMHLDDLDMPKTPHKKVNVNAKGSKPLQGRFWPNVVMTQEKGISVCLISSPSGLFKYMCRLKPDLG